MRCKKGKPHRKTHKDTMIGLKWFGRLMDRIFAVIGALIFAQAPLFMQEYTQQLLGRESELRLQVDAMRQTATLSGKTLEILIQKFLQNPDKDIVYQGEMLLSLTKRWESLSKALTSIQQSSAWRRPFVFLFYLDTQTFTSTYHHFKIGLPLSLEGGSYALLGILFGYLVFLFLRYFVKKFIPKTKKPATT